MTSINNECVGQQLLVPNVASVNTHRINYFEYPLITLELISEHTP